MENNIVNDFDICKIKKQFFIDNPMLIEESDCKDERLYMGIILKIVTSDSFCFIPFESKLSNNKILKKTTQWALPSSTRPNAGLNFEKCLVINNLNYVIFENNPKIASSQMKNILVNKDEIKKLFLSYVNKYIKACSKNRQKKEFIFKFTTLHHFHNELGITKI